VTSELSDGSLNQLLLRQLLSLLAAAELGAWVLAPACGVHGSLSLCRGGGRTAERLHQKFTTRLASSCHLTLLINLSHFLRDCKVHKTRMHSMVNHQSSPIDAISIWKRAAVRS